MRLVGPAGYVVKDLVTGARGFVVRLGGLASPPLRRGNGTRS